jgi:replication fork protection complex subunit Tof1/Swi1
VGAQAHEWRRRNEGGSDPGAIRIFVDSRIVCVAQPKSWTELQAGIECLMQLLALLEAMASTNAETPAAEELHEAAALLQQQLVYNGQVLDAALDGLRVYKDGTQSLMFLRSSVHLAYSLMRMLEKWAKTTGDGSYVRKRVKPKKKRKAKGACELFLFLFRLGQLTLTAHPILIVHGMEEEPDGVPDAEEEELAEGPPEDDVVEETMFTFEGFELVRGRTPAVLLNTHIEPVSDTNPRNSQTRRSRSRY